MAIAEPGKKVPLTRRPLVLFFLFMLTCSATIYGGMFLFVRVRNAHEVVQDRYRGKEQQLLAIIRETMGEAIKGGKLPERRRVMVISDVATYDPEVMEMLDQEGIDLEDVNAIRVAMRQVFNDPDPEVRAKAAAVLYEKHGLTASAKLLKDLEKIDAGRTSGTMTLTEEMKGAAKSLAESLREVYQDLVKM